MAEIIDSFIIGAYWGSRAEALSEVINKVSTTLRELREVDNQFLKYYRGGISRKEALKNEVSLDHENIKKLCLTSVKKGELDENGVAKNGFILGVWTGQKNDESSAINFTVGDSFKTSYLSNCCVLSIPYEGAARTRLLQQEVTKRILEIMVKIWYPDYAVLTSDSLREKLNVGNELGWITYRKVMKRFPKLSDSIVYEKAAEGHWFYVSPRAKAVDNIAKELLLLKSGI